MWWTTVLLSCAAPQTDSDSVPTDGPTIACDDPTYWYPQRLKRAVTYTLYGAADDLYLGARTSVGDIDGDGKTDVAVTGRYSPNIYLVLGRTLLSHPPGAYDISTIADYRLRPSSSGDGEEWGGFDLAVLVQPGHLVVSTPLSAELPMAYDVAWENLEQMGAGTWSLDEVARSRFVGHSPVGTYLSRCDVNGDGEPDLILGSRYLLPGPVAAGDVDVDERATLLTNYRGGGYPCGGLMDSDGLVECGDFNADGFADLLYSCGDVSVFYGSPSMGARSRCSLEHPDVHVDYHHGKSGDAVYIAGREAIAPVSAPGGDMRMALTRNWADRDDNDRMATHLFDAGPGFFPTGTELTDRDATFVLDGPDGGYGWDVSVAGDLNGDGVHDIVVGDPGVGGSPGTVYVHYCPLTEDSFDPNAFGDVVLHGYPLDRLGFESLASGDLDGNGVNDLVLPLEHANQILVLIR